MKKHIIEPEHPVEGVRPAIFNSPVVLNAEKCPNTMDECDKKILKEMLKNPKNIAKIEDTNQKILDSFNIEVNDKK